MLFFMQKTALIVNTMNFKNSCFKNNFYFSSDINSLTKYPINIIPDITVLSDYFNYDNVDNCSNTFFGNIKQLEPGSYLRIFLMNNLIS